MALDGEVNCPTPSETPAHDLDGNLTRGVLPGGMGGSGATDCDLAWDAENRLIRVTPHTPAAGLRKIEYGYDYRGRRIERRVYDWDPAGGGGAGAWQMTPTAHVRYVWFGWLKLLEVIRP